MKAIKCILVTLIALLLTGCYTQLQYSQKMNKVTDKNKKEVKENYGTGEEQANNEVQAEEEYAGEENAVPVYYKDYEYAERYNDCNCNPYNVYNFYGSPYDRYGYNHYRPYYSHSHLSLSSFYFHKWHHRRYFGYPRFAFSFSLGSPHFYHSFYHDPFYYGYGYSPFAYNYHRYYGSFGYGYYYGGSKSRVERDDDTRYGPRSIGTNRVANGDRTRSLNNGTSRSATVTNSRSAVRTRSSSVGTTRSRGTVNKTSGSVNRTRSRSSDGNSSSGRTRSRSGDNMQSDNSRDRVYIDRTDESNSVLIDRDRYNAIRSRTVANQNSLRSSDYDRDNLQRARAVNVDSRQKDKPTFFKRMRGFFENNTSRIITNSSRSSSSTIRSRSSSSSSRSSVGRSKSSSSNRSSVSRSSSSSNNSRSRGGSSSSSRSRSGGDSGSSSSDRSRGN